MDANVLELKLNQAAADAINRAGSLEEIKAAAVAEAERQNTATTTAAAEKTETDRKAAEQKAAEDAGKVYTRTETINGRDFDFEANSPEELQQQIINAYRVASAVSEPVAAPVVEQPKQKTAAEIEAERAELELKWKRGEITAKDYIAQSGAVTDYLASQGISVDALKGAVASTQKSQVLQSWADATKEFYAGAGKDWPASNRNMDLMGMKLIELGLDETPSADALTRAYAALKQQELLFPADEEVKNETTTTTTPGATATGAAAATTTAPAVQQTAPAARQNTTPVNTGRSSSGLFGMSTGVPANTVEKTEQPAKPLDIPATASPAEIMEAWKVEQQKQGIDPNAAFVQTFGRR